jgi:hypothetical protein
MFNGDYRNIDWLWHHGTAAEWRAAIDSYWDAIKPKFRELEKEMNGLQPETLRQKDKAGWYEWLYEKYFVWKYGTNPARLRTTRDGRRQLDGTISWCLSSHYKQRPDDLFEIKNKILDLDPENVDIAYAIDIAKKIGGLGVAGASGLLALLFPVYFGTVDVFIVESLRKVTGLAEHDRLMQINGKNITTADAVILISIMRRKARENAEMFDTWSPRKIDMVLWVTR